VQKFDIRCGQQIFKKGDVAVERGITENNMNWVIIPNESVKSAFVRLRLEDPSLAHIKAYFITSVDENQTRLAREAAIRQISDVDFWERTRRMRRLACLLLADGSVMFYYTKESIKPKTDPFKTLLRHEMFEIKQTYKCIHKKTQTRGALLSKVGEKFVFKIGDEISVETSLDDVEFLDTHTNRLQLLDFSNKVLGVQLVHGWIAESLSFIVIENYIVVDKVKRAVDGLSRCILKTLNTLHEKGTE